MATVFQYSVLISDSVLITGVLISDIYCSTLPNTNNAVY